MSKVLVIEDVAADYDSIEQPLKKLLGKSVKVDRYLHDSKSRAVRHEDYTVQAVRGRCPQKSAAKLGRQVKFVGGLSVLKP